MNFIFCVGKQRARKKKKEVENNNVNNGRSNLIYWVDSCEAILLVKERKEWSDGV